MCFYVLDNDLRTFELKSFNLYFENNFVCLINWDDEPLLVYDMKRL